MSTPAFPSAERRWCTQTDTWVLGDTIPGMSLRDWFATHASEEDIADYIEGPVTEQVVEAANGHKSIVRFPLMRTRAQARYLHADAMLAARK